MNFIIQKLILIHKGSILAKIKSVFILSLITSSGPIISEQVFGWYFDNYTYVCFVLVAILFDHLLGSWVHAFIQKDFSMKKNIIGLIIKTSMVMVVSVMAEGMMNILGSENFLTDYFMIVSRMMVFIYPAGSALVNCSIITNGAFPPTSFMSRITNFSKNLNIKDLTGKENENKR